MRKIFLQKHAETLCIDEPKQRENFEKAPQTRSDGALLNSCLEISALEIIDKAHACLPCVALHIALPLPRVLVHAVNDVGKFHGHF